MSRSPVLENFIRANKRLDEQIRGVKITKDYIQAALSNVLIECGNTKVLCSVSLENKQPKFLEGSSSGWVSAEYSMLPASTSTRNNREAKVGKQTSRTQEIQRLIGRSLRGCFDLSKLNKQTLLIDADVIQADGGTRVAAITGSWMACRIAVDRLLENGVLTEDPLIHQCAAISLGVFGDDRVLVDLDYSEDSNALADINLVLNDAMQILEFQITSEGEAVEQELINKILHMGQLSISHLFEIQKLSM